MTIKQSQSILVIVDSLNAEDSSGSKVNLAFINSLISEGFSVKVLALVVPKELELDAGVILVKPQMNIIYFLSRIQRRIQRLFNWNLSVFLENIFGFSFTFFNDAQAIKKALKSYNMDSFELLITLSKGESFRPHYAVLKSPKWHSKWLAYIHDPYPFQNYPAPYGFVPKGAKQKHQFFKSVADSCKFAGFPSWLLAEHMSVFYPELKPKQVVIPHQYSSELTVDKTDFPNFFKKDKFSLVHTGNLIGGRSPEGLLKGFELFLIDNPEAQKEAYLYLVGPHSNYKELILSYNHLKTCIASSSIPYKKASGLQRVASVNVILEASKTNFSPFLPAKMAHAVYFNKPILVLSPLDSEVRRLFGAQYAYQTEADNSIEISKKISLLYKQWKKNSQELKLNLPNLQEYFSSTYLALKIKKILNEA